MIRWHGRRGYKMISYLYNNKRCDINEVSEKMIIETIQYFDAYKATVKGIDDKKTKSNTATIINCSIGQN